MRNVNWLLAKILYKHDTKPVSQLQQDECTNGVLYPVTLIRQKHLNMCEDASIDMVRKFFNLPISSLQKNPRGILDPKGLSDSDNKSFQNQEGVSNLTVDLASENNQELRNRLTNSGPMVMLLNMREGAHAVVCVGCTDSHIIFHDPLLYDGANRTMSVKDLIKLNGTKNLETVRMVAARTGKDYEEFNGFLSEQLKNNPLNMTTKSKPVEVFSETDSIKKSHSKYFKMRDDDYDPCKNVVEFFKGCAEGSKLFPKKSLLDTSVKNFVKEASEKQVELEKKNQKMQPAELFKIMDKHKLHELSKAGLESSKAEDHLKTILKTTEAFVPRPK